MDCMRHKLTTHLTHSSCRKPQSLPCPELPSMQRAKGLSLHHPFGSRELFGLSQTDQREDQQKGSTHPHDCTHFHPSWQSVAPPAVAKIRDKQRSRDLEGLPVCPSVQRAPPLSSRRVMFPRSPNFGDRARARGESGTRVDRRETFGDEPTWRVCRQQAEQAFSHTVCHRRIGDQLRSPCWVLMPPAVCSLLTATTAQLCSAPVMQVCLSLCPCHESLSFCSKVT